MPSRSLRPFTADGGWLCPIRAQSVGPGSVYHRAVLTRFSWPGGNQLPPTAPLARSALPWLTRQLSQDLAPRGTGDAGQLKSVWPEGASVACMKLFFEDEGFDGQLQRSVGKADPGMANVVNA